jgi:hypothetical protein
LHATDLSQLLEDTALFFVIEILLELTLFVAETPSFVTNTRWRHVQQDTLNLSRFVEAQNPASW